MPSMASTLRLQPLLAAIGYLFLGTADAQCSAGEPCHHMPIIHSTNEKILSKRAVEVQLTNRTDIAYYTALNIGTPAQQVYVQLDTGSFELWVNPTCSTLSASDKAFCDATGSYNKSLSSTATSLKSGKKLAYGLGETNITYVEDSIALPGASEAMTQVQFGVSDSSSDEFAGILGIGYGKGYTTTYPNFVDQLALQNQTSVKAFSVGLGSKTEQEGAIVFGGVDTSKFAGKLETLDIVPAADSPDGVPRYWVSMNNMSLTPPSGVTKTYANTSIDVFFDTGATLTLLPAAVANAIGEDFGAAEADASGYYNVDCSLASIDGTVNFEFGGLTVKVPYNEFIRTTRSGSTTTCVLGITASDSFTLLGDTFLRSAYGEFLSSSFRLTLVLVPSNTKTVH
ncbi:aspartic peptidase domain-containing protein [Coniella lustricola]|uniref:Aspartic peptidase domain-containing protein n=1 Tax=Coniella lustricola TaxID=2025994 RepID=A0A2T2ZTS4_9PEZI|nr:aspartic peptidase domain-containing protein [Coniella lustricola]